MRVTRIELLPGKEVCQLQAGVESDLDPDEPDWFEPFTLWYRFPAWCRPFLDPGNGDPFLAALLVPAMRNGEPLRISAPVSPMLLDAMPQIQDIYAAFDPHHQRIAVEAQARERWRTVLAGETRVGLFFSLGIDSFYSLLKNLRDHAADERSVTHLIPVHGFDVAGEDWDERFLPAMLANCERVAMATGKTLLPVTTNVRRVGERLALWSMMHGAALASVALALGDMFGRVLIAASATYDKIYPWGTHPVLDPLWSMETLAVIHDGCELDTIDKTRVVAQHDLVLDTLRVCPGYGPGYNCGVCLKCMRSMIDLFQHGRLDRCRTLPHEIDPARLRVAIRDGNGPVHEAAFRRRLSVAEATGLPPEVGAVIADYLQHSGSERSRERSRPGRIRQWLRRISP